MKHNISYGTLFAPRAYVLTRDAIVVERLGRAVVIPRDEVKEVRRIRPEEVGLAWRLFGSGGLFGSFGLFYSRNLGRFRAYVTSEEDLVLVTLVDDMRVVISPYPAHGFLDAVRRSQVENASGCRPGAMHIERPISRGRQGL